RRDAELLGRGDARPEQSLSHADRSVRPLCTEGASAGGALSAFTTAPSLAHRRRARGTLAEDRFCVLAAGLSASTLVVRRTRTRPLKEWEPCDPQQLVERPGRWRSARGRAQVSASTSVEDGPTPAPRAGRGAARQRRSRMKGWLSTNVRPRRRPTTRSRT